MKKIYILALLITSIGITVHAQEFKKFKVGLGLGYASASGEGASGGILVYLEPAYRINDNILVGLRMESALVTRGYSEDVGNATFDVAAIGSYTVSGQYYFNTNKFRPFVGAGLGVFSLAAVKVDDGSSTSQTAVKSESKFGFYPRVGFDFGHFNMSIDYNIIPKSEVEGAGDFKNSYLGVRVGFSIGGGRK